MELNSMENITNPTSPLMPSPSRKRRKLILIAALSFLVIFVVVLLLLLIRKGSTLPQDTSLPTPTPIQSASRDPRLINISPDNVKKSLNKIVKNIHWLSNNELAYTYYDKNKLQTVLAKTNQTKETVLSRGVRIKFAEFYWSKSNDLLIHELTSPSKAYLLTEDGVLENLNLRGFAYSWAPDGGQFFFVNRGEDGSQFLPSFYVLTDKTPSPVQSTLPDFTHSLWSDDGRNILLYTNTFDTHDNDPYLFNTETRQALPINVEVFLSPAWSPSGRSLAYLTEQGISIRESAGVETLIYEMNSSPQTTTFIWENENQLLVIDSSSLETKFLRVSLQPQQTEEILRNFELEPDQRIEFSFSPDNKTLALATEKDGLVFITIPQ